MSDDFYITALPDEALVHLHGRDIGKFLQGQLTCDLRRLTPGQAVAGAMCTVKGRVISDLWVVQVDDDHVCLRLRRAVAARFAENLDRYARFSRITVAVDERTDVVTGLYGKGVPVRELRLEALGACARAGSDVLLRSADLLVQRITLTPESAAAAAAPASGDTPAVVARAAAGSAGDWRALELLDGHFAIEERESEQFTPQTLNYDHSGRVAFDKGCYTGQEVVARLHYKGRAKQRLQVFLGASDGSATVPEAGSALLDKDGAAVGEILRTELLSGGDLVVAALLRHDEERDDLRLPDGRELDRVTGSPVES